MDANDLNSKINELAKRKAKEHVKRLGDAIEGAIKNNGQNHNMSSWFREDIQYVLAQLHNTWTKGGAPIYLASEEMERYYRSQILDEVLTKLPLVKELALMDDEAHE